MPKFHVEINWGSYIGNPCSKSAIIEAINSTEALEVLTSRVRKYKRCAKIHGGSAYQYADITP